MRSISTILILVIAAAAATFVIVVLRLAAASIAAAAKDTPPRHVVLEQGKGLLPLALHAAAALLLSLVLALSGLLLIGRLLSELALPFFLSYPAGAVFGLLMSRVLFSELLSARCPSCRGRSFQRWKVGLIYQCRDCGYIFDTGIRFFIRRHEI